MITPGLKARPQMPHVEVAACQLTADRPEVVTRPCWPHLGRTVALNVAAYCASVSSISAGQRRNEQVVDALVEPGVETCRSSRTPPLAQERQRLDRKPGTDACTAS